jgi:hypothetical protein
MKNIILWPWAEIQLASCIPLTRGLLGGPARTCEAQLPAHSRSSSSTPGGVCRHARARRAPPAALLQPRAMSPALPCPVDPCFSRSTPGLHRFGLNHNEWEFIPFLNPTEKFCGIGPNRTELAIETLRNTSGVFPYINTPR